MKSPMSKLSGAIMGDTSFGLETIASASKSKTMRQNLCEFYIVESSIATFREAFSPHSKLGYVPGNSIGKGWPGRALISLR